jgi:3-hydroxybutyryl-CoA dehydrogenase
MINNICICGAGTMGSGIAQLVATSALPVILYEVSGEVLAKARKTIDRNLHLHKKKKYFKIFILQTISMSAWRM